MTACRILTVLLLLVLVILIISSGQSSAETEHKKTIRISGSYDFPPYSYVDEKGRQTGMATDITNEISGIMGVKVHLTLKKWTDVRADLDSGQADAIQDMFYSEERDQTYDFSLPWQDAAQVIFYRKSSLPVTEDGLEGKKVIVVKGDIGHDYMQKSKTESKLTVADTYPLAVQMLESGRYDCMLMERLTGLYWIKQLGYRDIDFRKEPLFSLKLCYAARDGDDRTISLLNDGLAALKATGRYRDINEKWMSYLLGQEVKSKIPERINTNVLTPEERAWLDEHRYSITLAPQPAWPPIDFLDESGKYSCFTSDYLELIQERLGFRFRIVRCSSFQERLDKTKKREIDVLTSLQKTPDRERYLDFTKPYLTIPCVIITRKDSRGTYTPAGMKGMHVATVSGYAVNDFLRDRYNGIDLVEVSNDEQVLQKVALNEVDAGICDLAVAPYLIRKEGISNLKMAAELNFEYNLCLACRNDEPMLKQILEKGIGLVTEDEKRQLFDKWVGIRSEKGGWRQAARYITIVAGPLLLALLAVLLWSYSLRHMVQIRTRELQQRQKEIEELNADLERKVEERTRELSLYAKELEAFSFSVSHDLRAPLRSIDGFSQFLLEDYNDRLDDKGKDYLARIRASSQKMGSLIESLLRLSRITRKEIRMETVDLSSMADAILKELANNEPGRKAELVVQPGIKVHGDSGMLNIVMSNLLENAWKYTQKKDIARIEFGSRQNDGHVEYYVKDNGAGFNMEYAGKLFSPFQRLHTQREFPGIGIGLAIVQRIVNRHGGEIRAVGVPEEGCTFIFTIPEPQ